MGTSEERKDIAGRKVEKHFDDEGRYVGDTEHCYDIFNNPIQKHRFEDGSTVRTEVTKDLFGNRVEKHYQGGLYVGKTEYKKNITGQTIEKHISPEGIKIGTSEHRKNIIGQRTKKHYGKSPKYSPSGSRSSGSSCDPPPLIFFFIIALPLAIVVYFVSWAVLELFFGIVGDKGNCYGEGIANTFIWVYILMLTCIALRRKRWVSKHVWWSMLIVTPFLLYLYTGLAKDKIESRNAQRLQYQRQNKPLNKPATSSIQPPKVTNKQKSDIIFPPKITHEQNNDPNIKIGGFYRYVDEDGVIHISKNPPKISEKDSVINK